MRLSIAVAIACLTLGGVVAADPAQAAVKRRTDIPAQALGSALQALAKQRDFQIVCRADLVTNIYSSELSGEFTSGEALGQLLSGTNLTYRYLDDKTVTIVPMADTAPAAIPSSSALSPQSPFSVVGTESPSFWSRFLVAQAESPSQVSSASSEGEESGKLEEIVVTAQRREEKLQDVPISISVLDGEALDSSTFTSMNDALRSVPGIVMLENPQMAMAKIAIRGVSSNTSAFNSSAVVGYYLDEIPFAFVRFPLSPDTGAYDVERVEVLRGPQGTLYGASSLNGVVRVLTQDADLNEAEFKARTTLSSTHDGSESYRGDAALSVPVIPGKLAIRGVAGYTDNGGWIDKPLSGRKDTNDSVQKNYRLKVNAAPVDNFSVEFMTWLFRQDGDGFATARDDRTSATGVPEDVNSEYDAYGLTLSYDFPGVSILSATNHIEYSTATFLGSTGLTAPLEGIVTRIGAELTSQEFRLSSTTSGPWRWTAGAIYRDEKDTHLADFTSPTIQTNLSGTSRNIYASKSFAVFGELTRGFFDDRWTLTGGLRYFEDDSSSNELDVINPPPPVSNGLLPFGLQKDTYDAVTPRLVLTYKPSEARNYYASFSQGFRSGFSQGGGLLSLTQGEARPVRPDKLSNYEVGIKGSAFDGRMSYELSAYYIDWKDTIQVASTLVGPALVNLPLNSEGVAGPGVDAATSIGVTDRLDFAASVSWNDLGFVDDVMTRVAGNPAILYPKDSRPPQSSETTASAELGYTIALPGKYSGRLTGSVNYLSKMLTSAATTAAALAGDDLTIARSSFTLEAPAGWSAMLFVDNLTDEDGRIQPANPANPLAGSDRLRPRTYGLQLDYRFN